MMNPGGIILLFVVGTLGGGVDAIYMSFGKESLNSVLTEK